MNKTPREILFERHRTAEDRLGAIRERVLARELTAAAAPGDRDVARILACLPVRIWKELFWSCRRVWAGLAAAWLLIIAINFQSLEEPASAQRGSNGAAPVFWTFLLEQKQLLAELGDVAPVEPPPQPAPPRPRSDRRELNRVRC
jgi:hypothetical protein